MKPKHILLDMDGVLADFFTPALARLNARYFAKVTVEDYVKDFGKFFMEQHPAFDIGPDAFWRTVEGPTEASAYRFWSSIKPFPWATDLYFQLTRIAEVTICTSPSRSPWSAHAKVEWMKEYFNVDSDHMILGGKKHLLAKPDHLLIDDRPDTCGKFRAHCGGAVCPPSNWNTPPDRFNSSVVYSSLNSILS